MRVGYCRVSTNDQLGALEQQTERLRSVGIQKIYTDVLSGSNDSRKNYQSLINDVEKGLVKEVVCTRVDRLGRSTQELLRAVEIFNKAGCKFTCLDQPIDLTSSSGKLVASILSVMAEFEKNMLVERIRHGIKHRKNQKLVDTAPFGYRVINGLIVLDSDPFICLLDSKEERSRYQIAREFIDLYLSGLGKGAVLEKIYGKYNIDFLSITGLGHWLKNINLVGDLKIKNDVYFNNHTPLCSREEFKKISDLAAEKKHGGASLAYNYGINPLKNKIKCAACGASYQIQAVTHLYKGQPAKYRYFVHAKSRCTSASRFTEKKLYTAVKEYLEFYLEQSGPNNNLINKPEEVNPEIENLKSQLQTFLSMPRNKHLELAINSLQEEIEALESMFEKPEKDMADLLNNFDDLLFEWKPERKNESNILFCGLIEKIVVSCDNLTMNLDN